MRCLKIHPVIGILIKINVNPNVYKQKIKGTFCDHILNVKGEGSHSNDADSYKESIV